MFPNQMNPPTKMVYEAVFHVRTSPRATGTAFSLKVGESVYLITAAHLVLEGSDNLQVFHDGIWNNIVATQLHCDTVIDLAIYLFPAELMRPPSCIASSESQHYLVGQHVFFLGYPLGDYSTIPDFGAGVRPLPFVRWGSVAMIGWGRNTHQLVLDAYNVEGFSGGSYQ